MTWYLVFYELRARLPPELVAHIAGFWAHVGYY
jgi:hypothetical protein